MAATYPRILNAAMIDVIFNRMAILYTVLLFHARIITGKACYYENLAFLRAGTPGMPKGLFSLLKR
jgi:hypothetical protein